MTETTSSSVNLAIQRIIKESETMPNTIGQNGRLLYIMTILRFLNTQKR